MFQIKIDSKFSNYDRETVRVVRNEDDMIIQDLKSGEELFSFLIPIELEKSFSMIPEKRGYIKVDDKGDVYFTLIRYVDYHLHSQYSLLDGANKIDNIVKKSEGCSGISDHGVMFGVVDFYKKMQAAGKKHLIEIEVYTESKDGQKDGNHLILIVKNETGWKNICKIISKAETNFYRKPHVSYEMLEEHHEGLICTTACLGGEVSRNILNNNYDGASEVIEILKDIFGDDLYIEIQEHEIGTDEEVANNALFTLAIENDVKVLGAVDAHYTNKEDAYAHEVLLCVGTKKKISDVDHFKFEGTGYHIHSADEFEELFSYNTELISNGFELVDKCNFNFDLGHTNMPNFDIPEGFSSEEEYFKHQCYEGFKLRFEGTDKFDDEEYKERLEYEIKQIINTGFPGYFLIVQDYILWAKKNGIYVGPGRGSCVGSLVSYSLRITNLDPMPYGLLFERFINPERISPPDIDVDFEDCRRGEVVDYIKEKYGAEKVSNIITFGTLAARAAIRDVGRVLEKDLKMIDELAKSVPKEVKITLEKALKISPDFKNLYDTNPDAKEVVDIAIKLEGLSRNKSQHACFDKETLVTTRDGLKRIIDVEIGDEVFTVKNRFKKVLKTIKTTSDEVYTIYTSGSLPFEVTENHPMYSRTKSKRNIFSNPEWKRVDTLKTGDYLGIPINKESIIPKRENSSLPFENESFWWLIGRYLGNGWTEEPTHKQGNSSWKEQRTIICCSKVNEKEKKDITKHLNEVNFKYRIEEARTTYKIFIKNKDIFYYLQDFGKYAHGKHLNKDILNLPIHLLEKFIDGYVSADGSYNHKTDRYSIKSVSKELIVGVSQCINKVYHKHCCFCIIPAKQEVIENRTINSKQKYEIHFTKDIRSKEQSFFENDFIWTRISKIERITDSRDMYNLTVLNDSSYTVNGICAHNCGIIIANNPINEYVPEVLIEDKEDKKKKNRVAAFNMVELEELGLLKADFLGLRNMTVERICIDSINSRFSPTEDKE